MAGLQVLEEHFKAQGLHVLGFLSNDFGNQGGSDEEVGACTEQYGVTFEQFVIGHVKDVDGAGPEVPQPVFDWLLSQPNPEASGTLEPDWNFHKYLVSREGKLVGHWVTQVYPGDNPDNPNDGFETSPIVQAIEAELAKP